ncbi:MAG: GlxA family transcriptional regulator [Beijerinckiaceae bacterium]|nr:GlxA family transcriptional regulator [Beijerinckiaceae bacterium]
MSDNSSLPTQTIGFVLVPNFALMSYASATEPLRAANLIARMNLYAVRPMSLNGEAVKSSAGFSIPCDDLSAEGGSCHTVFVVAGGNPFDWQHATGIYPLLRRLARQGVRIGGISSGPYLLAEAGLLEARDFTIHWEHAMALREAYPRLAPRQARYVVDGDRITCGGGIAPLDMIHALIAARMGSAFARRVSDWFLHTSIAEPSGPQRASMTERYGTHHRALLTVLEKMESTIEKPLGKSAMARLADISPRHLDRLFEKQMASSFLQTYRNIRLEHARKLLEQSALAISEIAFATGFSSASHFARAYKHRFGIQPKTVRV